MIETDYLILGAGLTGLAAGYVLKEDAVLLECTNRPGGLVKSEHVDGFWFDHVLHLLHFRDSQTESTVRALLDNVLKPVYPNAMVETSQGVVAYPFQMHLESLPPEIVSACIADLARETYGPQSQVPSHFKGWLKETFGEAMCELFFYPYNRKVWKRPLDGLATSGFQWNIARPDFYEVMKSVLQPELEPEVYNSNAWYPVPPQDAKLRGMEVLSAELARHQSNLLLQHNVTAVDLERRVVTAEHKGESREFHYRKSCLSSIPLTHLLRLASPKDIELENIEDLLPHNRVLSVMLCVKGQRPSDTGLWRYYADESVCFTRLIFMHEFDPFSSPEDGWGLMAEITQLAEEPVESFQKIIRRTIEDAVRVKALPHADVVINSHVHIAEHAYVVFTVRNQPVIERARQHFLRRGLTPLGRYGSWEYSSMAQVMRDGFAWAAEQRNDLR